MHALMIFWRLTSCIVVGLFCSVVLTAKKIFYAKHPNAKLAPTPPGEKLYGLLATLALCACPILHLLTGFVLLFQYDEVIGSAIRKIEEKIIKDD